jgi:Holliday junction resolvase RusA-like endonuclease
MDFPRTTDGVWKRLPPFAVPEVVLDLPVPLSVNRTRKLNRAALHQQTAWEAEADAGLTMRRQYSRAKAADLPERVELIFILCEKKCRHDLDNVLKNGIDYLRRLELIRNDDKRYVRKITVQWGDITNAPAGCRVVIRGHTA